LASDIARTCYGEGLTKENYIGFAEWCTGYIHKNDIHKFYFYIASLLSITNLQLMSASDFIVLRLGASVIGPEVEISCPRRAFASPVRAGYLNTRPHHADYIGNELDIYSRF
jgi:hypothetical protein